MNDLVTYLNQSGYDVLNVALYGHRGSLEEMRTINYTTLIEHARLHLCELLEKSQDYENQTIIFLGYSSGAVLQGNLIYQFPQLAERDLRIIWIEPSFQFRWSWMFRLKNILSGRLILPSWNLESYTANRGASLNAYKAIDFGREKFTRLFAQNPELIPPSLIVMNPEGGVLSFAKSREMFSSSSSYSIQLNRR